jgi:hypothetical protein
MKHIFLLLVFIVFIIVSVELTLHLSSNILIVANKITNTEFVQPQKQQKILIIKFFKDLNEFIKDKAIGIIKKCHI